MNGTDREYFETRFTRLEQKIGNTHDDVLILKTKWDMTAKVAVAVSGFIALITSIVVKTLWR